MFVDAHQRVGCDVPLVVTSRRVAWRVSREHGVYTHADITHAQHACVLAFSSAVGACTATLLVRLRRFLDSELPHLQRARARLSPSDVAAVDAATARKVAARQPRRRLFATTTTTTTTAAATARAKSQRLQMHPSVPRLPALAARAGASVRFCASATAEYAYSLAVCVALRNGLCDRLHMYNALGGVAAGAVAGASYAALRYPYDVLCSTARATAASTLRTAAYSRPWLRMWRMLSRRQSSVRLRDVYVGAPVVVMSTSARMAMQFGVYNMLRHDAASRHDGVLYAYCYVAALLGLLVEYPALGLTHQLRVRNATVRGPPIGHAVFLAELRRRHGITKVYDGFFAMRPLLAALAPAALLTSYELSS